MCICPQFVKGNKKDPESGTRNESRERQRVENFVSPQMNGEQQSKFPVIFQDSLQRRKLLVSMHLV